jgi:hypothetical protein
MERQEHQGNPFVPLGLSFVPFVEILSSFLCPGHKNEAPGRFPGLLLRVLGGLLFGVP